MVALSKASEVLGLWQNALAVRPIATARKRDGGLRVHRYPPVTGSPGLRDRVRFRREVGCRLGSAMLRRSPGNGAGIEPLRMEQTTYVCLRIS